jgi:hypothetical protein
MKRKEKKRKEKKICIYTSYVCDRIHDITYIQYVPHTSPILIWEEKGPIVRPKEKKLKNIVCCVCYEKIARIIPKIYRYSMNFRWHECLR